MRRGENNSKYKISSSKSGSPLNSYEYLRSQRDAKVTENDIDNLCTGLIDWANREDAESLLGFYKFYGIPRSTFDNRVKAWPQLSEAKEIAKDIIAERLQRKSFHREYNCDFKAIQPILRKYHYEWQEVWEEEKASQSKIQEAVEIHMKTYNDQDNKPR